MSATVTKRRSGGTAARLCRMWLSAVAMLALSIVLAGCGPDSSGEGGNAGLDIFTFPDLGDSGSAIDVGPDLPLPQDVGDDAIDVGGGETTDSAVDDPRPRAPNVCGGQIALTATPGDACGDCLDGVLVCDGVDALACHGSVEVRNACGTCERLTAAPGDPCGCSGALACDAGALLCFDTVERNACGGCAALPSEQDIGHVCNDGQGVFVCAGPNNAVCRPTGSNLCGGAGALSFETPELANRRPGDACGACALGVVVCSDGGDTLLCEGGDDGVNGCETCGPLAQPLGDACGCGGIGTWVCDAASATGVRCEGAESTNACGGCVSLDHDIGAACENDGRWVCGGIDRLRCASTPDALCGEPEFGGGSPGSACGTCDDGALLCSSADLAVCSGESERNVCGGCGLLAGEPGELCAPGRVWRCTENGALECEASQGTNACGGLATLRRTPGERCGACGDGLLVCISDEDVACLGEGIPNACGGCGQLPGVPGRACGTCNTGRWACSGPEDVICAGEDRDAEFLSFADVDEDGFGDPDNTAVVCPDVPGFVRRRGDCDDTRPTVFPGAPELCDEQDNDCDDAIDEDFLRWSDRDGDGFGDPAAPDVVCGEAVGFADNDADCDDDNPAVFPGQTEAFDEGTAAGGWDYDCDGTVTLTYPLFGQCGEAPFFCNFATSGRTVGWSGDQIATCGERAEFLFGCLPADDGCEAQIRLVTQSCR